MGIVVFLALGAALLGILLMQIAYVVARRAEKEGEVLVPRGTRKGR